MCTSIAMHQPRFLFGRNLDLEYTFGQQPVMMPRNFPFALRRAGEMNAHFAMIGMATVQKGYPLFAEAMNEKGLGMAGLHFPGNAFYSPREAPEKINLTPFELIPYVLGQCETVSEARTMLRQIHLLALPFDENTPLSPLHWHLADRHESLVLEVMADGMHLYDNPANVMTNNPPFDFHLTNLHQYLNLTATRGENRFSKSLPLAAFGNGLGGIGLPGDLSPASRFVRATFMLHNSVCDPDEESCVTQYFHLLDSVAMVRGSVLTGEKLYDLTNYACCFSAETKTFYYKTYRNNRITAIQMREEEMAGAEMRCYPLRDRQDFAREN